jgi:hypothetical protein
MGKYLLAYTHDYHFGAVLSCAFGRRTSGCCAAMLDLERRLFTCAQQDNGCLCKR